MNCKSPPRQLVLFAGELPTWESLPSERPQAVQEVVSLLLERMLAPRQHRPVDASMEENTEKDHV